MRVVCGPTLELQLVRRPAVLQGHDVRHCLAAAADARDTDWGSLEVGNAVILGACSGDDRPVISDQLVHIIGMHLRWTNSKVC